jgi:uncharacterized coiled-coil protein SlyX
MASPTGQVSNQDRQERRIQELEFVVTHMQKTVDDLNTALLLQQKKVDIICRQLEQAKSDVRSMMGADNSPRSLADEKPPHY